MGLGKGRRGRGLRSGYDLARLQNIEGAREHFFRVDILMKTGTNWLKFNAPRRDVHLSPHVDTMAAGPQE
ncbi:hypothetical protein [Phyllobacterium sp. K27]